MLEVLEKEHGCEVLNKNTNELPNTGRSKKHLLETGAPRMICCVTVVCKGTHFKILEIDTSDGIKLISTRVVMVADDEHWNDNYRILKQRIIASYLTWPIYYLNEVFGVDNHMLASCTLPIKPQEHVIFHRIQYRGGREGFQKGWFKEK